MLDTTASCTDKAGWNFDNSYISLPQSLYQRYNPTPVREPHFAVFNHSLAEALGLNSAILGSDKASSFFSGNQLPPGAEPIAQAYAGHQFAHFTMLGDGRAILLGEQITPSGQRYDIQLKGAGETPFSRRGDGRAALGPMLREYIVSEAMHALGIPTTRSLAVTTTGEPVMRDTRLPGAVLTRVAASHIRVGTFEYVSAWGRPDDLQALADYTLARHYPELAGEDNRYLALLQAIMDRQAALVAQWQLVGFIHGVMNTDNMALSGETIDYGPCAFMDVYAPETVFSSIDTRGRYAYGNQPLMAQWNLARLTETLLPLLHENPEQALELGKAALAEFPEKFKQAWLSGMRAKLGLLTTEEDDTVLIEDLLTCMHQHCADFTQTFRQLSQDVLPENPLFSTEAFKAWHAAWQARLNRQPDSPEEVRALMRLHNPAVIPRNHQVENALKAAVELGDYNVMHRLLNALQRPFAETPENVEYRLPPEPGETPYKTFCGT